MHREVNVGLGACQAILPNTSLCALGFLRWHSSRIEVSATSRLLPPSGGTAFTMRWWRGARARAAWFGKRIDSSPAASGGYLAIHSLTVSGRSSVVGVGRDGLPLLDATTMKRLRVCGTPKCFASRTAASLWNPCLCRTASNSSYVCRPSAFPKPGTFSTMMRSGGLAATIFAKSRSKDFLVSSPFAVFSVENGWHGEQAAYRVGSDGRIPSSWRSLATSISEISLAMNRLGRLLCSYVCRRRSLLSIPARTETPASSNPRVSPPAPQKKSMALIIPTPRDFCRQSLLIPSRKKRVARQTRR